MHIERADRSVFCTHLPFEPTNGDVGTPPPFPPGDFAAWFEAYLGGQWYTFDARNNVPRIGRVLLARGRDAADVAITTTFGPNTLSRLEIVGHNQLKADFARDFGKKVFLHGRLRKRKIWGATDS